ncbi:hypothetical protein NM688_g1293 [Phlebia brevispora]|uniref:Uncharacterized protein n=1 Tax=Phlebia brevispora TaxID=194682 RepID=A0ACC1TBR8_9APHY|nr:hypothetical protein NM688_g1293 [Phlebia brevispora]
MDNALHFVEGPGSSEEGKDEELLAGLGYRQEFKRAFRPLEVFGIAFSLIGLIPSAASTLVLFLPNGGSVALVWGWTMCSVFAMTLACALAELSSAAPTAGGLYFWTFKYASWRWRYLLSWIVGYSNTMGLVAAMAATEWGCAVQLMAAVSIGSNMAFTPTTVQLFGVFVAIFVVTALTASLASAAIARMQAAFTVLNLLLCIGFIVAVPATTPSEFRNTAVYVFGHFSNLTTWPEGFTFVLGLVGPLWVLAGYDAPVHMSEEASNAATAVPAAIVSSLGTTALLGFGVYFAVAFNMGTDIETIMASPIGQPMATILFNSFGTRGTLVIWSFIVVAQWIVGVNTLVACSRQTFAFARDGALPLSRYLYHMNPYTQTPVNCVWAVSLAGLLLGLLAFAGPSATNAIFSLTVVGLYIAYTIPIASRLSSQRTWRPGPFSLGKLSVPIAVVAVLWNTLAIIIVMFPTNPGPDGETMNYTVVVSGGWLSLCVVYYYFPKYGGVHWFKGPMANINAAEDMSESVEEVVELVSDEKYAREGGVNKAE